MCSFRRDGFLLVIVHERKVSREIHFNSNRICNPGFLTVQVEPVGLTQQMEEGQSGVCEGQMDERCT